MNGYVARHFRLATAATMVLIWTMSIAAVQADDPNAVRDGTGLLAATWDSATRCLTAHNPKARPDVAEGTVQTTIKVSGSVEVLDFNDLIAVATTRATALWAFDQDGEAVLFDADAVVRPDGNVWVLGDRPKTFCVELPLDFDQPYVASLSELAFTVEALYGQPFTTIDVPIEVSQAWIEIVPRYRIQITKTDQLDDHCFIAVTEEVLDVSGSANGPFDPNAHYWDETADWYHTSKVVNFDVISHAEIVDLEGRPVRSAHSYQGSSREGMLTQTREFTLNDCASLEELRIRYTIAMDPYEATILLTLTDIPVPGL